jgi:hypothetical protein
VVVVGRAQRRFAEVGLGAFMAFVAGLLAAFDRYLTREHIDLMRDGVTYRMAGLWLDDAELAELGRDMTRVLQPRLANPPGPDGAVGSSARCSSLARTPRSSA